MILLVAIGLLILAALSGAGSNQPVWRKEGYRSYEEYKKAITGGREKVTFEMDKYYFHKALKEWQDPKWTDPELIPFIISNNKIKYVDEIANKMAYDDGYAPFDDMRKYNPDNIHESYWRSHEFLFKKWKEEGVLINNN